MNARIEWIEEPPALLGQLGALSKSDVLGLQAQMNVDNQCIGAPLAPLVEDGIPGDATCEMAKLLNSKTGTPWDGSICPGGGPVGSYPADELCQMAAARKQQGPPPPGPDEPPPGEKAITSGGDTKTSPWLWAALGVVVVVGGVVYMRGGLS